jgi:hypothetical protein
MTEIEGNNISYFFITKKICRNTLYYHFEISLSNGYFRTNQNTNGNGLPNQARFQNSRTFSNNSAETSVDPMLMKQVRKSELLLCAQMQSSDWPRPITAPLPL